MADDITTTAQGILAKVDFSKLGANPSGKTLSAKDEPTFLKTAGSAFLENVGFKPTPGAEQYRAENPKLGLAADIVGIAPMYIGGVAATRNLPGAAEKIEEFAAKGSNIFTKKARESVATLAPTEGARLVADVTISPEDWQGDVAQSAANMGIEYVGGGLIGAWVGAGKTPKPSEVGPDSMKPDGAIARMYSTEAPQLKLRDAKTKLLDPATPAPMKKDLEFKLRQYADEVRLQKTPQQPVRPIVGAGNPDEAARSLNRLWNPKGDGDGGITRRMLVVGKQDGYFHPDKTQKRNAILKIAGLEDNYDAVGLPRYLEAGSAKSAEKLTKILRGSGMKAVDDRTLMAKEQDGLYVMARKVNESIITRTPEGRFTSAFQNNSKGDGWVIWKTDQPGRFVPGRKFEKLLDATDSLWKSEAQRMDANTLSEMVKYTRQIRDTISPIEFRDQGVAKGSISSGLRWMGGKLGMDMKADGVVAARTKDFVRRYWTPRLFQFKNSPMGAYLNSTSEAVFAKARQDATRLIHGEFKPINAQSGVWRTLETPQFAGTLDNGVRPVEAIVKSMTQADIDSFVENAPLVIGNVQSKLDELWKNGEITEGAYKAMQDLNRLDTEHMVPQLLETMKTTGQHDLNPLEGHLMFSRVREGHFQVPIYDESGNLVWFTGAKTPGQADRLAKEFVQEAEKRGVAGLKVFDTDPAKIGKEVPEGSIADRYDRFRNMNLLGKLHSNSRAYGVLAQIEKDWMSGKPVTFRERLNVGGYKVNYTQQELLDQISGHIRERYEYMADKAINHVLQDDMIKLAAEDPATAAQLADRLRQMTNKPGPVNRAVNQAADAILKPVLGRNSATQLSGVINEFTYHLQLGMMNIAYPVMNMTSVLTQILPEVALVKNLPDSRLAAAYYDVGILGGPDLKPRGNFGVLHPVKMLGKGIETLRTANPEFQEMLNMAIKDGVIDPQFVEDYVGATAKFRTTLGEAVKGEDSWVNFVRTLSSWLPSKSEKLSRGMAFATGYNVGKDLLGMQGEQLFRFANKFTQRTMFNYGGADRPTIITGPMGRLFGLFKNWQFHYLHIMSQYLDEGVRHNNWAPLMWQMGTVGGLGGIAALPFADQAARAFSNKDSMELTYSMFGAGDQESAFGNFSDAAYFGLPAFMGLTMSSNIAMPFSDPMRDATHLFSFPQWERTKMIGQALGGSVDRWMTTGDNPFAQQDVRQKWIAALAPKTITRFSQWTADQGIKSLKTDKTVMKDLSMPELIAFGMGFNPKRIATAYETADALYRDQDRRRTLTSELGKTWAEAQQAQDWDTLQNIQMRAMAQGLDISKITKSAAGFMKAEQTEQTKRNFSKESQARFTELGLMD